MKTINRPIALAAVCAAFLVSSTVAPAQDSTGSTTTSTTGAPTTGRGVTADDNHNYGWIGLLGLLGLAGLMKKSHADHSHTAGRTDHTR